MLGGMSIQMWGGGGGHKGRNTREVDLYLSRYVGPAVFQVPFTV